MTYDMASNVPLSRQTSKAVTSDSSYSFNKSNVYKKNKFYNLD